jgi:hypothetical protein
MAGSAALYVEQFDVITLCLLYDNCYETPSTQLLTLAVQYAALALISLSDSETSKYLTAQRLAAKG